MAESNTTENRAVHSTAQDASTTKTRKPRKGAQAAPVATKTQRTRKPAASKADRSPYAALSFVRSGGPSYSWSCKNLFEVPDEEYGDGWMTGLRAFEELQQFVKTQPQGTSDIGLAYFVQWVTQEAFKAFESAPIRGKSKRGAAAAFVQCTGQFLLGMLRANDGRWMAEKIIAAKESTDRMNAYRAEQRAEKREVFIARMQAARAAKRAAGGQAMSAAQPDSKTVGLSATA